LTFHFAFLEIPMSELSLSSFSAELERLVAATAPAIVAVHSHRSRASGFARSSRAPPTSKS